MRDRSRLGLVSMAASRPRSIPNAPTWGARVYAIAFDLDTEILAETYHNESWRNGYADIAAILGEHGFERRQGSVYFGDASVDPVRCVLAVQDVAARCPWFRLAVKDVRMLRIEENNDLMPAIEGPGRPVAAE